MIHPTFVVIGAMRSGTTSLHYFLEQHPEIYMSPIKGPGLYIDPREKITYPSKYSSIAEKRRGLSDGELLQVMRRGLAGERHFGESTDLYARYPAIGRSIAGKMLRCNPDMKLLYIMRNPLERIVSQFLFEQGKPRNTPAGSLDEYLRRGSDAVWASLYGFQISRFLASGFSPENVLLIVFEAFRQDPGKGMRDIADFLGIDHCETPEFPHLNSFDSKSAPRTEVPRFYRKRFRQIRKRLDEDLEVLEGLMGKRITAWDLSDKTWCGPEGMKGQPGQCIVTGRKYQQASSYPSGQTPSNSS